MYLASRRARVIYVIYIARGERAALQVINFTKYTQRFRRY